MAVVQILTVPTIVACSGVEMNVGSEVSDLSLLGLNLSKEASEINTVFVLQLRHGNQQNLLPQSSDRVAPSNQKEDY